MSSEFKPPLTIKEAITVDQIERILDEYFQEYKSGVRRHANILFEGYEGYGRYNVINRWLKKQNELKVSYDVYPGKMHKDVNGVLKIGKGAAQYTIPDDELEALSQPGSALVLRRINYGRDQAGDSLLYSMIKDRRIETFSGKLYDLDNLFMVIATAYKEDSNNRIFPIEELKNQFDVFEVKATMQETAEFIYKNLISELEYDEININKKRIADCLRKWPEQIQHTEEFSPARLNMAFYVVDEDWDDSVESFCNYFVSQLDDKTIGETIKKILAKTKL